MTSNPSCSRAPCSAWPQRWPRAPLDSSSGYDGRDGGACRTPTLAPVSAAHHYGHDQLVFQFRGGVQATYNARYVFQVIRDASGLPVNIGGQRPAAGQVHPGRRAQPEGGIVTYGAMQRTYALPQIIQVVNAGRLGVGAQLRRGARAESAVPPVRPAQAGPGGPRCEGAVPDRPSPGGLS